MIESSKKRVSLVRQMLSEKARRIRIASRILTQELGWDKEFPIPLTCCEGCDNKLSSCEWINDELFPIPKECSECNGCNLKCRYNKIIDIVECDKSYMWVADEISAMHLILDGHELITNPEILKEREIFLNNPENQQKYPLWYKKI